MPKKSHRAGTFRDLLSGRMKRRDEKAEAIAARIRKLSGKAKRIELAIVILAGPCEAKKPQRP